jgi:hypothetical protein|tara:strand:+ start:1059 stop:1220 length:162 start_codon:yes stop_codon:yes gene_type:complete
MTQHESATSASEDLTRWAARTAKIAYTTDTVDVGISITRKECNEAFENNENIS